MYISSESQAFIAKKQTNKQTKNKNKNKNERVFVVFTTYDKTLHQHH